MGIDLRKAAGGSSIVHLDAPCEEDGKPNFVPSPFTVGLYMYLSCRGDELIEGEVSRGTGTKLYLEWDGTEEGEEKTKSGFITFHETVEMHDGSVDWNPADWGPKDEWTVCLRIGATSVTPNGSSEGNCNLVAAQQLTPWSSETSYSPGDMVTHGGVNYACIQAHSSQEPPSAAYWINAVNVIIPAAGDGDYDVDLSAAIVVPYAGEGYWAYAPWDDEITPGGAGSDWMLFDFAMPDNCIVKPMHCGNHLGHWDMEPYKVEPVYARWQFGFTAIRDSNGAAWIAGNYTCYRMSTL